MMGLMEFAQYDRERLLLSVSYSFSCHAKKNIHILVHSLSIHQCNAVISSHLQVSQQLQTIWDVGKCHCDQILGTTVDKILRL